MVTESHASFNHNRSLLNSSECQSMGNKNQWSIFPITRTLWRTRIHVGCYLQVEKYCNFERLSHSEDEFMVKALGWVLWINSERRKQMWWKKFMRLLSDLHFASDIFICQHKFQNIGAWNGLLLVAVAAQVNHCRLSHQWLNVGSEAVARLFTGLIRGKMHGTQKNLKNLH